MKKEYTAPAMEVININTMGMLLSMSVNEKEVDPDEALGREDGFVNRPSNPNLWEQSW